MPSTGEVRLNPDAYTRRAQRVPPRQPQSPLCIGIIEVIPAVATAVSYPLP
jgi:hypothetical protein